jgi:tetratricopeptide (TPR) repeat protein
MPRLAALLPVLLSCWSCAAPGGSADPVGPADAAVAPSAVDATATRSADAPKPEAAVAVAATSTQDPGAAVAGVGIGPLMWQDASFRQRFAESYLAETDIEPPALTEDEYEVMAEVVDLRAKNQLDNAIVRLQEQVGPKASATFDLTLAKMLLEQQKLEAAAASYEESVRKHPKFRRAWHDLGLIRYQQGQYRKAIQAIGKVVELGGASATIYGFLGFSHANVDDFLAAESAFRLAAMLDPASNDWRMGLAHSVMKQQRFAEAASLFGTMITGDPDRGELWLRQATAFLGMNESRKAAENLEILDRMGQSTAESLETLGNIYTTNESYDLAANAYVRGLYKESKDGLDRGLRAARALAVRGAGPEALHLLDRLEEKWEGKLAEAQKKEVLTLRARSTPPATEDEAKLLEQIVTLDPLDGDALIKLGRFHEQRGEFDKAVFRYERAAGVAAFEAEAKLNHARLLASQSKYSEALPLLRRSQALKPRDNVRQFLEQVEKAAQGR